MELYHRELHLSVWFHIDGTFRIYRDLEFPRTEVADSVFIVRETPWPRRDGNLLWG
jgi:hypothetical protein